MNSPDEKLVGVGRTYKILLLFSGAGISINKLDKIIHNYDLIEITAIEYDLKIAAAYEILNPNTSKIVHKVIIADVYQIIKEIDLNDFDLIMGSPNCQSHSKMQRINGYDLPDFRLYSLLVYLFAKIKGNTVFIIENVGPWYSHNIEYVKIGRHIYYSNIELPSYQRKEPKNIRGMNISDYLDYYEFNSESKDLMTLVPGDKRQLLRNGIHPEDTNIIVNAALQPTFKKIRLEMPISIEFASERIYSKNSNFLVKQIFPQYLEIENLTTGLILLTDIQLIHCWMIVQLQNSDNHPEQLRLKVNQYMDEIGLRHQKIMNAAISPLYNISKAFLDIYNVENLADMEEYI